jgi:sialic acid synthase SpsE
MQIKIGNKYIGEDQPCFIVAEAGVNHNGDIKLAQKMVDEAVAAGVDAIKFQTFKAEKIVTPTAERAKYQVANIGGEESQYDMLKRLELEYDEFGKLKQYCDKRGITFLSTPHSCKDDVNLVAGLCPAIKVGSGDLTNLPILKYMAEKKLPILLSTGMSTLEEVREAVEIIRPMNKHLILLHCTTNYPTPIDEVNLKAMLTMYSKFSLPVGYSDHTVGIDVSVAAVAMGACVIEKHFTLDRTMEGPDHKASLEPYELKQMVADIRRVEQRLKIGEGSENIVRELDLFSALGDGIKRPTQSEIEIMKGIRKSVVAATDILNGTVITEGVLAVKRPGTGISPKHYWEILGKKAKRDIEKDSVLSLSDFQ